MNEPQHTRWAERMGSAAGGGLGDDSLKDLDHGAWMRQLSGDERARWLRRIRWIRGADRLAEQALLQDTPDFTVFMNGWHTLKATGRNPLPPGSLGGGILGEIQEDWFDTGNVGAARDLALAAWECYIGAIERYHRTRGTPCETLGEFETMLDDLSGSLYQVLPDLRPADFSVARRLGILDQFFNILRDVAEDAAEGLCYFPADVLAAHGLNADDFRSGAAVERPGYGTMLRFWLDDFLPRIWNAAPSPWGATELPGAWRLFRAYSQQRYERTVRVYRASDLDYQRFAEAYWREARMLLTTPPKATG